MENCILTSLVSSINNNKLRFRDEITVKFLPGAPGKCSFQIDPIDGTQSNPDTQIVIKAISGSFNIQVGTNEIKQGLTSYTMVNNIYHNIFPAEDNTEIRIIGKRSIANINKADFGTNISGYILMDFNEVNYSSITNFYSDIITGYGTLDVSKLPNKDTMAFLYFGSKEGVDSSVVVPSGTTLPYIFEINVPGFIGKEMLVMNLNSITGRNLRTLIAPGNTKVTGDLNTLLNTLYTNGKTSGELIVSLGGTNVTYTPAGGEQKVLTVEDSITNGWKIMVTFTSSGWTSVQGF